jgi:PAS domain S-box-containing protein
MRDQSMAIVAMGAIPRYLSSQYYNHWSLAHLREVEDTSIGSDLKKETGELKITATHSVKFGIKEVSHELDRVLISSIWLREMLAAIENLPLCVSVASASNKMRGFPLIYVNAAFETTTGYYRDEIIGQNCRFLQSNGLETPTGQDEIIAKISHALKEAQPIRIALTNYRKDGSPFHNLLAMKPIMNQVCQINENENVEYL